MRTLLVTAVLVLLVDQTVKLLLRRWLGSKELSFEPLGRVRLVDARIWLARTIGRPRTEVMWLVWVTAAIGLVLAVRFIPASAPFAGLVLGGSLSHLVETSLRGTVSDYICARFWPAFNLADAAIVAGATGLAAHLFLLMRGGAF